MIRSAPPFPKVVETNNILSFGMMIIVLLDIRYAELYQNIHQCFLKLLPGFLRLLNYRVCFLSLHFLPQQLHYFPYVFQVGIIHPSPIYTLFPILIGVILSQSGCCSLINYIPPSCVSKCVRVAET